MPNNNTLYQEAILDALKVKEAAIKDAENNIMEAIAPRVREFIEQELLFGVSDDKTCVDDQCDIDDVDATLSIEQSPSPAEVVQEPTNLNVPTQNVSMPVVPCEQPLDAVVQPLMTAIKSNDAIGAASAIIDILKQTNRFQKSHPQIQETKTFQRKVKNVINDLEYVYKFVQENVSDPVLKSIVNEQLETNFKDLKHLQEVTMKNNKRLLKEDEQLQTTEPVEQPTADVQQVEKDTTKVSLNVNVPSEIADELVSALGEIEISLDGEESEEGSEELELTDDVDAGVEEVGGDEQTSDDVDLDSLSDDTVVDIDESMLRRELMRMRSLKENFPVPSTKGNGPGDTLDDFGGATEKKEPLDVDVTTESTSTRTDDGSTLSEENDDDEDKEVLLDKATCESLRTKIAVESKKQKIAMLKVKRLQREGASAKQNKDMKTFAAKKIEYISTMKELNESIKRSKGLKARLDETVAKSSRSNNVGKAGDLRRKLAESNLNNVKLQYANKLLQNNTISTEAKYKIVEQLESASSTAEAKIIFESSMKLFSDKKQETINESAGSASRPTRSTGTSQQLNEGFEVARWCTLAGIK